MPRKQKSPGKGTGSAAKPQQQQQQEQLTAGGFNPEIWRRRMLEVQARHNTACVLEMLAINNEFVAASFAAGGAGGGGGGGGVT